MSRKNIIEVRNVTMRFGGVTAVSELTMDIPEGSIVGLIGPQRRGQNHRLQRDYRLYRPTEGEVVFAGRRITGMDPHRICALGMARTFQNIRLFYNETALENVMIGRHVRRSGHWWGAVLGLPGARREERDIRDKALELLRRVGSPLTPTKPPLPCPTAHSAAWKSPEPWPRNQSSCCSTNPPQA